MNLSNVRKALRVAGDVGDHPDDNYNRNALPIVDGLTIKNVWGENIQQPGLIKGIKDAPFTRICLSNVKLSGSDRPWTCEDVSGGALQVQPSPCTELASTSGTSFCTNAY